MPFYTPTLINALLFVVCSEVEQPGVLGGLITRRSEVQIFPSLLSLLFTRFLTATTEKYPCPIVFLVFLPVQQ